MAKHWHYEQEQDGIVWLHLDLADSSTNTLSAEVLSQLEHKLEEIRHLDPTGIVILSDKSNGFIAGADVSGFVGIRDPDRAESYIQYAHTIFNVIESFSCPTLALIHGFCLGGGLELALACRYRVVASEAETRLGFPEVRLGIFPGFGGTVRSQRLLGALPALSLMLSGRSISASNARRLGLVDLVVPQRQLRAAALQLIQQQPEPHRPEWWHQLICWPLLRSLAAALLKRQVEKKVNPDHYPAPFELLAHWRLHGANDAAMYANEIRVVAALLTSSTAQNLIRVFMLQQRLKALGKTTNYRPQWLHVIGGGIMGGDIAAWCALKGLTVTLQEQNADRMAQAIQRAHQLFRKKLRQRHLIQAASDRLIPDHNGYGVPQADVIIEAIFEDSAAKQALYQSIEPLLRDDALLATNTSSIPLEDLSLGLESPQRLVGIHFFNPVAKMQLIEVVYSTTTDQDVINRAMAFATHIGRLPLPVKSSPGFLVNRVLLPYLLEAVELLQDGVQAEQIDAAAKQFGMPMGPVELADVVGLDICMAVADKLSSKLNVKIPEILRQKVVRGKLGRKSGDGFYHWKQGRAIRERVSRSGPSAEQLANRLIMRLLNEAVACLREGVVADPDLLDAGIIFGTGFAPFRGGPMHFANNRGVEDLKMLLHTLEQQHGIHFSADHGWKHMA